MLFKVSWMTPRHMWSTTNKTPRYIIMYKHLIRPFEGDPKDAEPHMLSGLQGEGVEANGPREEPVVTSLPGVTKEEHKEGVSRKPNIDSSVEGRLKHFAVEWAQASRWQQNVISRGLRWKFIRKPPKPTHAALSLPSKNYSVETEEVLLNFHREGVIKECVHPKFVSGIWQL